jgi:hypothetical protein
VSVGGFGQALAGASGHLQRVKPRAMQLQDLGAVNQAMAGEGHQVGMSFPPCGQRVGPLVRAAKVEHLQAGVDH